MSCNEETKDTSTIVENNGKPEWSVYQRHHGTSPNKHLAEPENNDSGADDESQSQSKENDPLQPKHKSSNVGNKEVGYIKVSHIQKNLNTLRKTSKKVIDQFF